jgi:hypothetical protein
LGQFFGTLLAFELVPEKNGVAVQSARSEV